MRDDLKSSNARVDCVDEALWLQQTVDEVDEVKPEIIPVKTKENLSQDRYDWLSTDPSTANLIFSFYLTHLGTQKAFEHSEMFNVIRNDEARAKSSTEWTRPRARNVALACPVLWRSSPQTCQPT